MLHLGMEPIIGACPVHNDEQMGRWIGKKKPLAPPVRSCLPATAFAHNSDPNSSVPVVAFVISSDKYGRLTEANEQSKQQKEQIKKAMPDVMNPSPKFPEFN